MTFLGKLLAFLNLLVGLAVVTWSVSVYANTPGWFGPVVNPDDVQKGQEPVNFAMVKQEVDGLTKTADIASGQWGENLKVLVDLEQRRASRQAAFANRIKWARTGNPADNSNAFYETVYEADPVTRKPTGFVDTTKLGKPIDGPDGKPLKGSDNLLLKYADSVKKLEELALQNAKHREDLADVSKQIVAEEGRLLKMIEIRDSVQAELFYLGSFELNVYETRTTVLSRKRQLSQRLTELSGP